VDMVGHQMPFLDFRFFLQRELPEYLAQIPAQFLIQRLAPTPKLSFNFERGVRLTAI